VQEPFLITKRIGEEVYEIKLDQIAYNASISKEDFDFPKSPANRCPIFRRFLKNYRRTKTALKRF
jgi:hypothetical protein